MVVSSTDSMTSLPDRGQALAAVLYVLLPGMRGLHVEAGIWERCETGRGQSVFRTCYVCQLSVALHGHVLRQS